MRIRQLMNMKRKTKGFFLALEGIDGSGKTTVASYLKKVFENKNKKVLVTQEPTKEKVGSIIRRYLEEASIKDRDPVFEALAFATDRRWHINKEIIPSLNKGYLVISDRYFYSSFAYQTVNGLDLNWLCEINKYAIKPDLAIFLDVNPRIATKRIKHPRNIFEKQKFLNEVYLNYMDMVRNNLLIKINGDREIRFIVKDIVRLIEEKWK